MAVSEQTPYIEFIANGATTTFALGFECSNPEFLIVKKDGVIVEDSTWQLVSNSVVFNEPPSINTKLVFERDSAIERSTNFQTADNSFRPAPLNNNFDYIIYILQEISARLVREITNLKLSDTQLTQYVKDYVESVLSINNPEAITLVVADIVQTTIDGGIQTQQEFNEYLLNYINIKYPSITEFLDEVETSFNNFTSTNQTLINTTVTQAQTDVANAVGTIQPTITQAIGTVGGQIQVADLATLNTITPSTTNQGAMLDNGDIYRWKSTPLPAAWVFTGSNYYSSAKSYTDFQTRKLITGVLGKNLFNIDSPNVSLGMYPSNGTGAVLPNASYNTTGFIPVVAGQTYTAAEKHYWCWYDANKVFISGTNNTNSNITQTAPTGAAFMRASCSVAGWATFQVELGSTKTAFEVYISINTASIKDESLNTAKLANKSVTPPKISFLEQGKNLFNISASDNVLDKYVNYTNGTLANNTSYNATGFILVDPSKTYTLSYFYMRAFYNENKVFISGDVGSSATFTPPAGAVYARFTVAKSSWGTFQVEFGSTATAFEKYGFKFTSDIVLSQSTYVPTLVLPPKIYALAGLQSHIYPEHLLVEDHKLYEHDIVCSYGQQRVRGFEWDIPVGQSALSTSLSWSLYDKQQGTLITTANSTLIVANPSVSTAKKVCVIGDSLVNAGVITQRLLDISATDPMAVTLIGSKGTAPNKHEGRGGWTIQDYTDAGRIFYKLTVSGVTTAPALNAARYSTDGTNNLLVQEVALIGGSGTIIFELYSGSAPTSSGALTKINASTGDATIAFSAVQNIPGNPFWNTTTSSVDFANYLTRYSLATPDVVLIQLGVNDTFNLTSDAAVETFTTTGFARLDALINSIKAANSSVKIGVISSPNFANQDAFGTNYACGQTSFRARRNIITFNKKLYEYYRNKEAQNIYAVGSGASVDTEYNLQTTTRAINSQNPTIVTVQSNGVHPDTSGYKQISDALFAFLKAI